MWADMVVDMMMEWPVVGGGGDQNDDRDDGDHDGGHGDGDHGDDHYGGPSSLWSLCILI